MMRSALMAMVLVAGLAQAQPLKKGEWTLSSGYLPGDAVRYNLQFRADESVSFQQDKNTCGVDAFGRTLGCSRVRFDYEPTELVLQDTQREGSLNYELYGLKGFDEFRLVVRRGTVAGDSFQLLRLNADGHVIRRIDLATHHTLQ